MSTIRYNCSGTQFEIVLPDHGRAHEWVNGQPGNDVISVHPRMLAMLRTTTIEDSVVLNVSPFYYMYDNQFKVFKSDTINMTDYLPTTPAYAKLVLVGLDMATNTLSVVEGAEQFDSAVTPPPLPDNLPLGFIPSALVKLRYNVTVLNEVDVTDARIYIVGNIAGGIDSSGEPAGYVLTADGSGGVVWESVASGGAWPAPNKCKNGETEYDTLEAAIAASTPSDTIKVGEGEFELTDTVAISHGLTIVGTGPGRFDYGTYIYAATGNPALSTGSTLILSNLSIEGIDSSGYFLAEGCYLYDLELSRNGTIGRIDNCSLDTSNTSYALNCTGSGTIDLFDCIIYDAIEGTGSVTINMLDSFVTDNALLSATPAYGGEWFGEDYSRVFAGNTSPTIGDAPLWDGNAWIPGAVASVHNALSGLQGTGTDYYHLNADQYSTVLGYPAPDKIIVDGTDVYDSWDELATILDDGDIQVLVGKGTFVSANRYDFLGRLLAGMGRDTTVLNLSTASNGINIYGDAGVLIKDLTFLDESLDVAGSYVYVTGSSGVAGEHVVFEDVNITAVSSGTTTQIIALTIADACQNIVKLINCKISATDASVTNYAIYNASGYFPLEIYGGEYEGDINSSENELYLYGPKINGSIIDATGTNVHGYYIDADDKLVVLDGIDSVKAADIDAEASTIGQALLSDGAGNAAWGDIQAGGWPEEGKVKIVGGALYNTITLALAAATTGDYIKVGSGSFAETVSITEEVTILFHKDAIVTRPITIAADNVSLFNPTVAPSDPFDTYGIGLLDTGSPSAQYINIKLVNPTVNLVKSGTCSCAAITISNGSDVENNVEIINPLVSISGAGTGADGIYVESLNGVNILSGKIESCGVGITTRTDVFHCNIVGTLIDAVSGEIDVQETGGEGNGTYGWYMVSEGGVVFLSSVTLLNGIDSVKAGDIDAESSTSGQVLISDGAGNAAWGDQSGGGGGSAAAYVHVQSSASATWNVAHNLETENVSVEIWDGSDELINADVVIVDSDNLTITHSSAITGKAIVLGATAFTTPVSHNDLTDIGTNTHAQIDSHIGSSSNPHSVTAAQAGAVATSGNETVAGVKTFSSFPVTPSSAPTTDYQTANKKYVDDNAGGTDGVPTNLVAYTTGSVPSGWAEYTAARGRVIVGLPSGGTVAGTVGTALSNVENRTHIHVYTTVPSHRHSFTAYNGGAWTSPYYPSRTDAKENSSTMYTGYTGSSSPSTQATSHMMPYIQLLAIKKS